MIVTPAEIDIRPYSPRYAGEFAALRRDVMVRHGNLCLWAPGEEAWLWEHTQCAFIDGNLVAVGQARPVAIITWQGGEGEMHRIFLSIKTLPEFENCTPLYQTLYHKLLGLAGNIKVSLPQEYGTLLCVSLLATEQPCTTFFTGKGFAPYATILTMHRPLIDGGLPDNAGDRMEFRLSEIMTDVSQYTTEDGTGRYGMEPLGLPPLKESAKLPSGTVVSAWNDDRQCARLTVWEEGGTASIEDVFVQPLARRQGIGQRLVAHALRLIAQRGYDSAELLVMAGNAPAVGLYRTLGFETAAVETRLAKSFSNP